MEARTSTDEIVNRIAGLEELAQDLQRRVQDLETASGIPAPVAEQPGPQSNRERNRELEEAAPGGAQIPPGATASDPMAPRRDVLGSPHSQR
jgi:hypothetical protein